MFVLRLSGMGLAVWLITLSLATSSRAQQPRPPSPPPPVLTQSLVGSDLFASYCAPCHGRSGKGDGSVAAALKIPPADLTTLTRRAGGRFPADLVRARLNGTGGPEGSAHGTTDMPIWGSIFRQLDAKEVTARVRIDNIITYLQTLQAR